jgi:hypothetical protein
MIVLRGACSSERNKSAQRPEPRQVGRPELVVNREAVVRDRQRGLSIRQLAKLHLLSRTSVSRILEETTNTGAA